MNTILLKHAMRVSVPVKKQFLGTNGKKKWPEYHAQHSITN
jgi:hypothetical protein